jgi:hypothetical protein
MWFSTRLFYLRLTWSLPNSEHRGDNEGMTRRGLKLAVLACAAVLAAPALGAGVLPSATSAYLLGPKMIRAEILVIKGSVQHDFRLDRGKLVKRYAAGSLILLERDGTKTTVKVAPAAHVFLNGTQTPVSLRRLRAGMQIAVSHQGDLPAVNVYAATANKQAPKWPAATGVLLLGNKLVRGEIVLQDTAAHDYRLDHGHIKQVGLSTLVIHEADGTDVSIDVSPTAHVKLNGKSAGYFQLQKGMMATMMRDGDKPAEQIFATGK